ncbi:MAG: hypothetical protein GWP91_02335 [Rhodobacterales bacterium]|nr:hypothetical protein [Rhodobacterales bacterium]
MLPAMKRKNARTHWLTAAFTATILAGCGPLNPDVQSANKYLNQLQPLLIENSHLTERVLHQAAGIYNKDGKSDALEARWSNEITPLAEHLHHQSQFIEPPPSWSPHHDELVAIWGSRARAYRTLSESLATANRKSWDAARTEASDAKVQEEIWFKQMNQDLGTLNMGVDPSP